MMGQTCPRETLGPLSDRAVPDRQPSDYSTESQNPARKMHCRRFRMLSFSSTRCQTQRARIREKLLAPGWPCHRSVMGECAEPISNASPSVELGIWRARRDETQWAVPMRGFLPNLALGVFMI